MPQYTKTTKFSKHSKISHDFFCGWIVVYHPLSQNWMNMKHMMIIACFSSVTSVISSMHQEDDEIVAELLEYDSTGSMKISVFIELNSMDLERRKRIYRLFDMAKMLTKPPVDTEEPEL